MPKIQRVTDPAKIVTDPLVLRQLDREGIDPNFVEFFQDYAPRWRRRPDGTHYRVKECSPYAKFYQDRISGKRLAVISGLPMVKVEGHKIEPGWLYAKKKYYSKANLFSTIVGGKQVQLTCLSDQPNGTKKGDRVTYKPQLFIDGVEIINGSEPTLLPTDPINPNYKENTLEWAYGTIAERRVRIIEGRYRDRFFVLSHPQGRVSVKNNCIGNLKLKLGHAIDAEGNPLKVTVIGDEEIIEANEFDKAVFPVEVGASQTFYPAAGANSPVDGYAGRYDVANEAWATVRGGVGIDSDDAGEIIFAPHIISGTVTWRGLRRGIALFDTSPLPDYCIKSAATLSVYGRKRLDDLSCSPSTNIYSANPASNNALVDADYNIANFGTTPFATAIAYADWKDNATPPYWNDFVFNQDGLDAIPLDDVAKFGIRNVQYDVGGATPNYIASKWTQTDCYAADKGDGYKPTLVVIFTTVQTVTLSSVPTASSIQAPSVKGSGSVPIAPSPVEASSSIQAPVVSGAGVVSIGPSPVAASSAIQAPSVTGSGTAPVLLSPVQAVSLLQAPGVSGSGIASIYPDPIITTSSVRVPVTLMTCRAPELERELAIALEGKAHFEV